VARDLAARDHRVIAIDVTRALASLASEASAGPRYVLADGAMLPFQAATFDVAVAYNSLMDVDDMPAVVQEIGRVLAPGGDCASASPTPSWTRVASRRATRRRRS
jgi:ubiquinone/menaquinone biosynthesis C-methylase UbiE